MFIVASLNLFSSVMEASGQCIWLAFESEPVTFWSRVRRCQPPWRTSASSCELRVSGLRCEDNSVQSDRTGSDKDQALASTSNDFYFWWPNVLLPVCPTSPQYN